MVLVLTGALSVIVAALMHWTNTEMRLSHRQYLRLEAQNAAESTMNYGMATLNKRWATQMNFQKDELIKQPIQLDQTFITFLEGSNSNIIGKETKILGGFLTDETQIYIDPTDPSNQFDPEKGKVISKRDVPLYVKVKAKSPQSNTTINLYAKEILEIRDTPLFSHAVFYNMDVEFSPGPTMHIYGPVHTNGNAWVSAARALYFHSTVTAHKNFYQGFMKIPERWGSTQTGDVLIQNDSGKWLSTYKGKGNRKSESSYYDSRDKDWQSIASNRWDGNVQSQEHSISQKNAIGFEAYKRDDPDTATTDDALNHPYAIIEPNLSNKNVNHKGEGESLKYAQQAGLIIRIYKTSLSKKLPKHAIELSKNYYVSFNKLAREDASNASSAPIITSGNVQEIPIEVKSEEVSKILSVQEYNEDKKGKPTSGFYDLRRQRPIDIVELNIEAFRNTVDNTSSNYNTKIWEKSYNPTKDYNNVVYVEFPIDRTTKPGKDKIYKSINNTGLILTDAKQVPNPRFTQTNPPKPGFTLATNNVLYIKGHFNADGNAKTGSAQKSDSSKNPEPSSSLAADAIYVLSNNFDYTKTKQSKNKRKATFTEVNAAFLTGIYPTAKGGGNGKSGGNHNFPRFLENWRGTTFRYRGSMVALFESEIANNPISLSFYSAPTRDWGFYESFEEGIYPPATPNVRSFYSRGFKFLPKDVFDKETNSL
ncbi:MAG: hypothetical protein Tsb0018_02780 [Opitutales bacterium]